MSSTPPTVVCSSCDNSKTDVLSKGMTALGYAGCIHKPPWKYMPVARPHQCATFLPKEKANDLLSLF